VGEAITLTESTRIDGPQGFGPTVEIIPADGFAYVVIGTRRDGDWDVDDGPFEGMMAALHDAGYVGPEEPPTIEGHIPLRGRGGGGFAVYECRPHKFSNWPTNIVATNFANHDGGVWIRTLLARMRKAREEQGDLTPESAGDVVRAVYGANAARDAPIDWPQLGAHFLVLLEEANALE
jgi:hypothetical protein